MRFSPNRPPQVWARPQRSPNRHPAVNQHSANADVAQAELAGREFRQFVFRVAMVMVAGSVLAAGRGQAAEATARARPNVVVIYADDQGTLDLNCYGSKDLVTPHLDKLAADGVRFTQMYAPSAICSASRAGLLTGRYPARAGVPGNVSSRKGVAGMPSGELTLAELFQRAGYRTGHIGKWHLGYTPETMPNGQGFGHSFGHMGGCIDNYSHFFYWNGPNRHDLWLNGQEIWRDGDYFGDLMLDQCRRFVERSGDAPFFLYWAINWPHYPMQGTSKWRERYRELPHPRDKYATFVSTLDELVGSFLAHLEQRGLRDNTIVVYQSDHGHSVEERAFFGGGNPGPYRGCKGSLFEAGLRVPSIISWHGTLPAGAVRGQMVCGIDWLPTLADLAGIELPPAVQLDGKSIAGVIRDGDPSPHEYLYWQLGGGAQAQWAVRKGDWKLLGNPRDPRDPSSLTGDDREFLAHLKEDVGEQRNLARREPGRLAELRVIRERLARELAATKR